MDTRTPPPSAGPRTYTVRGRVVMLEDDLAAQYETGVPALIEAVRAHAPLFPEELAFRLSGAEGAAVRAQEEAFGLPPGLRRRPLAFTARGSAMLATLLETPAAARANAAAARVLAAGLPPGAAFDFEFCGPGCRCGKGPRPLEGAGPAWYTGGEP